MSSDWISSLADILFILQLICGKKKHNRFNILQCVVTLFTTEVLVLLKSGIYPIITIPQENFPKRSLCHFGEHKCKNVTSSHFLPVILCALLDG